MQRHRLLTREIHFHDIKIQMLRGKIQTPITTGTKQLDPILILDLVPWVLNLLPTLTATRLMESNQVLGLIADTVSNNRYLDVVCTFLVGDKRA